jgi:hypothetical protein
MKYCYHTRLVILLTITVKGLTEKWFVVLQLVILLWLVILLTISV